MAVPKKRTPSSKTKKRRSHHGVSKKKAITCNNCDEAKMPHQACDNCGYYKGRKVV